MIAITTIRDQPERVKEVARQKRVEVDIDRLLVLDSERRELRQQLDDTQRQRNNLAASLTGKPEAAQIEQGKQLKEHAAHLDERLAQLEPEYYALWRQVPNVPSPDTPIGQDESGNVVMRQVGTVPVLAFEPRPHWELGEELGVIDSERASRITGSRFAYLKGELALLQFALIQYALSVVTNSEKLAEIAQGAGLTVPTTPFVPVIPPVMVRPEVMERMARLEPREERYHIPSDDVFLVGSAEHTLGPLHMDERFTEAQLPIRYIGYSTSFRREAGSHGKDVRGILRLHQFDKLEIESFTAPEQSVTEQDFIVAIQEHLMQSLGLAYQVVLKCTADMGTPNYRAIDIETWLPGQNSYRETHTSDHMSDYQARRLRTKVKRADGSSEFVHTNDATVFAIGRTLIALMENYQQADGSIVVPSVLRPYVSFETISRAR